MTLEVSPIPAAHLIDVCEVAKRLDCSERHVYRLSDRKRMPQSIKLGALVRWSSAEIDVWIANGCPNLSAQEGQS